jgi:uncharacterized protein YecT (DUF1311 family)
MKLISPIFVLLLSVCPSVSQTQFEMNDEAMATLKAADAGMNLVYQAILGDYKNDAAGLEKFRQEQRNWLKTVSAKIAAEYPVAKGEDPRVLYGSMYSLNVAALKTELILARIRELQKVGGKDQFDLAGFCKKHEITLPGSKDKKPEPEKPSGSKSLGF